MAPISVNRPFRQRTRQNHHEGHGKDSCLGCAPGLFDINSSAGLHGRALFGLLALHGLTLTVCPIVLANIYTYIYIHIYIYGMSCALQS